MFASSEPMPDSDDSSMSVGEMVAVDKVEIAVPAPARELVASPRTALALRGAFVKLAMPTRPRREHSVPPPNDACPSRPRRRFRPLPTSCTPAPQKHSGSTKRRRPAKPPPSAALVRPLRRLLGRLPATWVAVALLAGGRSSQVALLGVRRVEGGPCEAKGREVAVCLRPTLCRARERTARHRGPCQFAEQTGVSRAAHFDVCTTGLAGFSGVHPARRVLPRPRDRRERRGPRRDA